MKNPFKGDPLIAVLTFLLSAFGIVAVYSASFYVAGLDYGNKYYYAVKQGGGFIVGAIGFMATSRIDYHKYFGKGKIMYAVAALLLALVFIPFLSVEVYGARRWLNLGFFTVQPSEIAKFAYVFMVAEYFAADMGRAKTLKGILPPLAAGGLLCVLIVLEPNMSITVCVGILVFTLLFLCGARLKHFMLIFIPALMAVPVLIAVEPYRLKRLSAFLDPWASPRGEGYQLLQSLYGLGSGGLFGVGLFNSRQKFRFLPFSESDFILSVIGEEIGFFGTLIFFAAMVTLILRGIKAASKSKDFYGYVLAMGIITVYGVQVIINALVVTGSMPPTGLPLPFISAGNTSLIVFMSAFGVLYNVSKGGGSGKTKKNRIK